LSSSVFREKHGVTRNDFLDCMIELRNKGRKGAQEYDASPEGRKNNPNFGKATGFLNNRWIVLWNCMKFNIL
jgi:hypothetical protein